MLNYSILLAIFLSKKIEFQSLFNSAILFSIVIILLCLCAQLTIFCVFHCFSCPMLSFMADFPSLFKVLLLRFLCVYLPIFYEQRNMFGKLSSFLMSQNIFILPSTLSESWLWYTIKKVCHFNTISTQESSPTPQLKGINFSTLSFLYSPTLTSIHDCWKKHSLDQMDLC